VKKYVYDHPKIGINELAEELMDFEEENIERLKKFL
jgi:hypothetical protein